jgi:hypothetical protein
MSASVRGDGNKRAPIWRVRSAQIPHAANASTLMPVRVATLAPGPIPPTPAARLDNATTPTACMVAVRSASTSS